MSHDHSHSPEIESWMAKQQHSEISSALSVVIPAYNEEKRIPPTLIDMIDFFDRNNVTYEIIVVDDGSSDHTADTVKKFERIRSQVRLIRVPKNYGKGHAVKLGALNAHGQRVLIADADGATPIEEIKRLEDALSNGADLAIGSRALHSKDTKVVTSWHRRFLGRVFNYVVNAFLLPGIADTQCGFKMFTARTARFLFERQKSNGFSFDIEILFLARKANLRIAEIPINWINVPGSKVNLLFDPIKMLRDIFLFKIWHRTVGPADIDSHDQKRSL